MTAARDEGSELALERACLARARKGDMTGFAELYRALAPRLYTHVLLPKLGAPEAAEDALSETFRALLEHLGELEDDGRSVWPWLCKVATHKAYDMHRKHSLFPHCPCVQSLHLLSLSPTPSHVLSACVQAYACATLFGVLGIGNLITTFMVLRRKYVHNKDD